MLKTLITCKKPANSYLFPDLSRAKMATLFPSPKSDFSDFFLIFFFFFFFFFFTILFSKFSLFREILLAQKHKKTTRNEFEQNVEKEAARVGRVGSICSLVAWTN